MTTRTNRFIKWGAIAVMVVVAGAYAEFLREAMQYSPAALVVCSDGRFTVLNWTCKQILKHHALTPETVAELNEDAGSRLTLYMRDRAASEEMLMIFLGRGVDINAPNKAVRNWTALFGAVIGHEPFRVEMLLRHGARVDIQDADGMTALNYARRELDKEPADAGRVEIVRLLEAAAAKR